MEIRKDLKAHLRSYENKTENKTKPPTKNKACDARARLENLSRSIDELSKTLELLARLVGNESRRKNKQKLALFVKADSSTINKMSTFSQEQVTDNKTNMANKRVPHKMVCYKKVTAKDYQTDFILH